MTAILWLRRDLRRTDLPACAAVPLGNKSIETPITAPPTGWAPMTGPIADWTHAPNCETTGAETVLRYCERLGGRASSP